MDSWLSGYNFLIKIVECWVLTGDRYSKMAYDFYAKNVIAQTPEPFQYFLNDLDE